MRNNPNVVLGLDVGSHKVCAVVSEIDTEGEIHILGMGSSVVSGVTKGRIDDIDEFYRSIERAVRRASRDASFLPQKVVATIPYHRLQFVRNIGVLLSKEETGQVSESDFTECIRRSRNVVKSQDQTMVHAIPSCYRVDGVDVQHPVGVFGKNLEVETLVVLADSDSILSQTRVLKGLNFHITGLVYDGIATSQLYLTDKERKEGAVLFDIGGKHTQVSIYKDDVLQDSALIPIGGETFSRDISECLKISLPEAERLKVLYGDVMLNRISSSQTIEATTQETGKKEIKTLLLCQILEARLSELLQLTQKQLPAAFEPYYTFVLGGGGARLKGVVDFIEQKYAIHLRDGLPEALKDSLEDQQYATSLGLILYALKTQALNFVASPRQKFFLRLKKWIGQLF